MMTAPAAEAIASPARVTAETIAVLGSSPARSCSRVDELTDAGHGARFDANKGTPMKEWFSLDPGSGQP